jgi:hypothetical protein
VPPQAGQEIAKLITGWHGGVHQVPAVSLELHAVKVNAIARVNAALQKENFAQMVKRMYFLKISTSNQDTKR